MNPLHGGWYAFWSGIGNDIPIYLLGFLPLWLVWWRKHRCHVDGCWRMGHPDPAHGFPACRHHHSKKHRWGQP